MAEVLQRIISCPNGHYYDANRYDDCPHCGKGKFSATIDPDATIPTPVAEGGTIDPNAPTPSPVQGAFPSTLPPSPVSPASVRFPETMPVEAAAPAGAPSPVVGWLVAVDGPVRGTDYRIHSNYNYIGREAGEIRIRGDQTISAERDTSITYVAKTRRFYIAHELGKNVLLVNDEPVVGGSRELKSFDVITIGKTELVFVALCGPQFSWEDGVTR